MRFYISAGCAMCLLIANNAIAQMIVPDFDMLPESLQGIVLFPDGETPVAKLPIRLWDIKGKKIIYRLETNEDGIFRIPRLLTGNSLLFVGRLIVNLSVIEKGNLAGQQHDMIVVMPRSMLVTGGRMFDVLISPILANAAVISGDKAVGERKKEKERIIVPVDETPPSLPPEPPIVSP